VPGSIEKTKQVENYSAAIKDLLRNNSHIFAGWGWGWCAAVSPNTSGAFLFDGDTRAGAAQRTSFGRLRCLQWQALQHNGPPCVAFSRQNPLNIP
jgi:hypothetical protein